MSAPAENSRYGMEVWRRTRVLVFLSIALIVFAARSFGAREPQTSGDSGGLHWTPVTEAQVKLDDKTPLGWNVYQIGKRDQKDKKKAASLALVLLGHRYLMLDIKARVVYEVPLSELHAHGKDFESGDLAQESRIVPSIDWTDRDVGPAELIRLTLGDYGRVLEISLPHLPDLRPFY